jgi:hypothetical protein
MQSGSGLGKAQKCNQVKLDLYPPLLENCISNGNTNTNEQ